MHITLSLGDFLLIAALVLALTRGLSRVADGPAVSLWRMQRQLDAIMAHLGLPEPVVSRPGALSPEVQALLTAGQRLQAIQRYRLETGENLKQARHALDSPQAV